MELDTLDHQILTMLGQNGRFSNVQIAGTLGVSHSTVKKRIDRMVDSGVCRVLGVVNPEKLGYGTNVIVLIKTQPGRAANVADALESLPEAYWIGQMMGRCDVCTEVILPASVDIFDVIVRKIARIPGVVALETLVAIRQTWWRPMEWRPSTASALTAHTDRWDVPMWRGDRRSFRRSSAAGRESSKAAQLDHLDGRIIALLQENGRRSAAEIGRKVGLRQPTVKNRVDKLLESGVCKVVGVINPEMIGLTAGAHIYVRTEPGLIADIGDKLARITEISWLCHTTGQFDILLEVHMGSTEEVLDFVARSISAIPGIRTTEVSLVVHSTVWRPAEWRPAGG